MTRRDFTKGLLAAAGMSAAGCQSCLTASKGALDPFAVGVISDIHTGLPWSRQKYRTGREYPWQPEASKRLVAEILVLPNPPANVIGLGDISLAFGETGDYEIAAEVLKPLSDAGIKVTLAMGNHDIRAEFLKFFPGYDRTTKVPGRFVSVVETPQPHFAGVEVLRICFHVSPDDAEYFVAPRLVAGRNQVVEVVPAWAEVMEIDGSCLIPQAFPQVCGDGFSPGLAQLHVAVAGPFRRGAGVDVELDADGVAVAVFLLEALLETLPVLGVVGIRKVEFGAIEAEAKRYRIAVSVCLGNQS